MTELQAEEEALRMALQMSLRQDFPALKSLAVSVRVDGRYYVNYSDPTTDAGKAQEAQMKLRLQYALGKAEPTNPQPSAETCAELAAKCPTCEEVRGNAKNGAKTSTTTRGTGSRW